MSAEDLKNPTIKKQRKEIRNHFEKVIVGEGQWIGFTPEDIERIDGEIDDYSDERIIEEYLLLPEEYRSQLTD